MSDFHTASYQSPGAPRILTLGEFVMQSQGMTREAFIERYSHPFLVQARDSRNESFRAVGLATRHESDLALLNIQEPDSRVFMIYDRGVNHFAQMTTVGRAANNDIVLHSSKVSKFHAYFSQETSGWSIRDCGSSNGTFLEEEPLEPNEATPLKNGQMVSFGRSLRFYFTDPVTMLRRIQQG